MCKALTIQANRERRHTGQPAERSMETKSSACAGEPSPRPLAQDLLKHGLQR